MDFRRALYFAVTVLPCSVLYLPATMGADAAPAVQSYSALLKIASPTDATAAIIVRMNKEAARDKAQKDVTTAAATLNALIDTYNKLATTDTDYFTKKASLEGAIVAAFKDYTTKVNTLATINSDLSKADNPPAAPATTTTGRQTPSTTATSTLVAIDTRPGTFPYLPRINPVPDFDRRGLGVDFSQPVFEVVDTTKCQDDASPSIARWLLHALGIGGAKAPSATAHFPPRLRTICDYCFQQPANFALPAFGPAGEDLSTEGAVIYENMRFQLFNNGRYFVNFTIRTPPLPVSLRLMLSFYDQADGQFHTINLPVITVPKDGLAMVGGEDVVSVEGYLPAYATPRRCSAPIGAISRAGSATFGFGLASK